MAAAAAAAAAAAVAAGAVAAAVVAAAAAVGPTSRSSTTSVLLGQLDNGLGFYRFSYNGSDKAYVGVMAQEVQVVMPDAVTRGRDGTCGCFYDKLGLKFQTYDQWIGIGRARPGHAAPRPIESRDGRCHEHDHALTEFSMYAVLSAIRHRWPGATMLGSRDGHSRRSAQQSFKTPQEAVEALVTAVRAGDRKAVNAILGPGAAAAHLIRRCRCRTRTRERCFSPPTTPKHRIQTERGKPATLVIGPDDYPFPIPIVQSDGQLDVRHRGRPRGNPGPPHRPQRARRDPGSASPTAMRRTNTPT